MLFISCLALAIPSAVAQSSNPSDITVSAKARAIQESAIVVDTHADTPQRFLDEGFDIGSTDPNDVGTSASTKPAAAIWARSSSPSG